MQRRSFESYTGPALPSESGLVCPASTPMSRPVLLLQDAGQQAGSLLQDAERSVALNDPCVRMLGARAGAEALHDDACCRAHASRARADAGHDDAGLRANASGARSKSLLDDARRACDRWGDECGDGNSENDGDALHGVLPSNATAHESRVGGARLPVCRARDAANVTAATRMTAREKR